MPSHFPCQAYPLPTMLLIPSFNNSGSCPCPPGIAPSPPSCTDPSPPPAFQCHHCISFPPGCFGARRARPRHPQLLQLSGPHLCSLPLLGIFLSLSVLDQEQTWCKWLGILPVHAASKALSPPSRFPHPLLVVSGSDVTTQPVSCIGISVSLCLQLIYSSCLTLSVTLK